ncbi:nuclear transport factor 2 family protein [Haliangium sp.]|uniref:nuclear transport factor 2 family protein n=1 Tax=Haliangium sp. TaxID=2663208 RepID=UPI003D0B4D74
MALSLLCVLALAALAGCQPPPAAQSTTPMTPEVATASAAAAVQDRAALEAELTALNDRLVAAYEANDVATLETMLAPEHIHNNVFGMRMDKDTFLQDIRSGELVFERYQTPSIQWFIYPDVAIATGTIEAVAYRGGKQVPSTQFTFTRVFVRRGDGWQVLLFQNTIVRPPPG